MSNLKKYAKSLGIKNGDIIIAATLLMISLIFGIMIFAFFPAPQYVIITANGTEIARLPLDSDCTYRVGDSNTVQISGGHVKMLEADCPDKLCVHTGQISRSGQTIVCLPNKVVVSISGEKNDVDVQTH